MAWRYAILCMHEIVLRAVPHFNDEDLKRFHKHFKSLFVDDYATVPHQSIERLLALHRAGRLAVLKLGSDYTLDSDSVASGAAVEIGGQRHCFTAFIDATGQQAVSAWDVPFPSLIVQGAVREARTTKASTAFAATDDTAEVATGGIDLDGQFRPKFEEPAQPQHLLCLNPVSPPQASVRAGHHKRRRIGKSRCSCHSGGRQKERVWSIIGAENVALGQSRIIGTIGVHAGCACPSNEGNVALLTLRRKPSRKEMIRFFENTPPTTVAVESCGGSHHQARLVGSFDHHVKRHVAREL